VCCEHCSHESSCLTTVPVFKGLNKEDIKQLRKVTHSRMAQKGEYIFREGERSSTLFVIKDGLVKLTKTSADGKEQIVRLLFPGDFFGLFSLLRDEKHYLNAETIQQTEICSIEKKDFLKVMEGNSDMAFRFLVAMNDRLYEADESVGNLSLMEVEQRLAKALLLFHEKLKIKNEPFMLPITKKDLASFIGTTPESVSRKLLTFMSQHIIHMEGQRVIQILELDQLKGIAELG
jgi:CRP-like cAMP-binding protein